MAHIASVRPSARHLNPSHNMNNFDARVRTVTGQQGLTATDISVIQVNIGLKCNLRCRHCHVVSSPERTESMTWATMQDVVRVVKEIRPATVDVTGGAPEMNPHFRDFVTALRPLTSDLIVRTNLTIMLVEGFTDLPDFFAHHRVHLVASLPCYLEENVDGQRGTGVFQGSIEAIRRLNERGYGRAPEFALDLVYNPTGPSLPPPQKDLEIAYKKHLKDNYGIVFNRLLTITNLPIGRFFGDLKKDGRAGDYMALLEDSFNKATLPGLMCRHQVSIRWDGTLFDCDFNLALKMPVSADVPRHVSEFDPKTLARRRIITGNHCFGCTAGQGSSCGGALVEPTPKDG